MASNKQYVQTSPTLGKTSAMVVDLRPTYAYAQQNREAMAKSAAERRAKKAASIATLDSLLNDIKVKGHQDDITFLGDSKKELTKDYTGVIAKHGLSAFADNPTLANELREKTDHLQSQIEWSVASNTNRTAMVNMLKNNRESDLDPQSVKDYKYWSDQDIAYRMTHTMPYVTKARRTISEIKKNGKYQETIKNWGTAIKKTVPAGEGTQRNITVDTVNWKELKKYKHNILTSGDPLGKRMIENAQTYVEEGLKMSPDMPNGEPNPDYNPAVMKQAEIMLDEELAEFIPHEGSTGGFVTGKAGAGKDDKGGINIYHNEKGMRRDEKYNALNVSLSPAFLENHKKRKSEFEGKKLGDFFDEVGVGSNGKKYYRVKVSLGPDHKVGDWVDDKGEKAPTYNEYKDTEGKDWSITKLKSPSYIKGDSFHMEGAPSGHNVNDIVWYIDNEGNKTYVQSRNGVKNVEYGSVFPNLKYKVSGGKYIFEGDKGYDELEKKVQVKTFVEVTGTKLDQFFPTPVTSQMMSNPNFRNAINAIEGGGGSSEEKETKSEKKEAKNTDYSNRKEGDTWRDKTHKYKVVDGKVLKKILKD